MSSEESGHRSLKELKELEGTYAMPTYARFPVRFVKGDGALLWDADGHEYVDFFAGLGVHNAGHCHPAIVSAIQAQVSEFMGSSNLYYSEPGLDLVKRLSESSLGGRVFLANTGTEANECAIKLVRKHAHARGIDRPRIVSLDSGFHGRSMAPLTATPRLAREDLFGPLPRGFDSVARDDPSAFDGVVGADTAAVIIEPIQGEAGVYPIADEVLLAAREACDRSGALLIFDEVQTGMGRTGSLWAYQQTPVVPDVMTAAKALGGGLPVGACVISAQLGEGLSLGDHGSTFAGGPVQIAAAHAALDVLSDPELLDQVISNGEYLRARLSDLDAVTEVRGRGLMIGIKIDDQHDAMAVGRAALREGLVLNVPGERTLRLLPPLTIDRGTIDRGLSVLSSVLG